MLGVRHVLLAVNKLDLVGYSREVFEALGDEFAGLAKELGIDDVTAVPVAAVHGVNVVARSTHTPWYTGPTVLEWLGAVPVDDAADGTAATGPARFLVQWVNRPNAEFRGYSGRVLAGVLRPGDRVRVLPGAAGAIESTVRRIVTMDGELAEAEAGRSVTVLLADELDVSRGDVLAAAEAPPDVADAFQARLVWLGADELLPGRRYLAKIGARTVGFTCDQPKYRVEVDSLRRAPAKVLHGNEIGVANVHLDVAVPYEPYRTSRDLGSFIVIDRLTNATVGAGMIDFALRRSANVRWQQLTVGKPARAALNGHRPCVVWFTGLSGAGKSTVADLVEKALHADGRRTFILDGDNVRHGLNKDLGFTDADRVENIRRIAEVASLMVQAGLIVLVSFISPFRAERELARNLVEPGEFCEVFVDTPLAVAEGRDPKGLYAKARRGELANFTGIDSPYEPPEQPEIRLDTTALSPVDAARAVVGRLAELGIV
jgi:bifunctional enzyme CysN/CysC